MAEECAYYYYDSGYCCELRKQKEGYSSIDSDTVHRYCWGYHYSECPRYRDKDGSGSSGCFLTSACVEAMGLPDDCHELTVLRAFRDGWLAFQPNGQQEICEYYHIAPKIIEKIKESGSEKDAFLDIYHSLVIPCVQWIETGNNKDAHKLYRKTILKLKAEYIRG